MTRAPVAAVSAALIAASGCGPMMDGVYLLSPDHSTRDTTESRPISQTVDRVEYAAAPEDEGRARLSCFDRIRELERTWTVTRTYRRRGGFGPGAYKVAAIMDGTLAGITAGSAVALCLERDASCWHALWATPFAISLGYSLIRAATARSPILVDRSPGPESLAFSGEPIFEEETGCEGVDSLRLGSATGPGDLELLRGERGERALDDGALPIEIEASGEFELTPEAAERWAVDASLELWALDRDGTPHEVRADRCELLEPARGDLPEGAREAYQGDCAPASAEAE